jgi:hypothetical protein
MLRPWPDTDALATGKALEAFDTDGASIQIGAVQMASRGQLSKEYQTPYGSVVVRRHGEQFWAKIDRYGFTA